MFEMYKCSFDKVVIRYASPVERSGPATNKGNRSHVAHM